MRILQYEQENKSTTNSEMYAVFGALFLIAVKRGNRANFSEFFTKNEMWLTILQSNFSKNRFRFLLTSIRFDDLNTKTKRNATDKLAPIRDALNSFISNSQN